MDRHGSGVVTGAVMRVRAAGRTGGKAAVVGGVLAMAVVACGSGAGAPEGWRPFDAGPVRLYHPRHGWVRLTGPALGGDLGAAALWRRGRELGRISIRAAPTTPVPTMPVPTTATPTAVPTSGTPAAGASTPAAGASTPAAGASTPAAGASTPAAGASTPAAGASTPAAGASTPAAGAPAPLAPGTVVRSSRRMVIDGRRMRKTEYTYTATAASRADAGRGVAPGTPVRGVDLVTERPPGVLVRVNAAAGALRQAQFAQIVNSVSLRPPVGR
jgi:hypothetical protein